MDIPVVDFEPFLKGTREDRTAVSNELIAHMKEYGFVYLKNYGMSNEVVEKMFKMSKEFFQKPVDYKKRVEKSHETFCGYDGMGEESLSVDRPGDLKESYMIKRNGTPWPSDWPHFKDFVLSFHRKVYELGLEVLRSFTIGLNLKENLFDEKFSNGEVTLLRLLHYPPLPDSVKEKQIRCGEHTDYGALTILFQDSLGGLQVRHRNGDWIQAPYIPDTILINIGDVMEIWTNGTLISTEHRVINPEDNRKEESRYSIAFFFDPDLQTEIKPLNEFTSESIPAKYASKTFKDHLFGKYSVTYSKF
jgi:isopenicillin N synthase-like dioxygenase